MEDQSLIGAGIELSATGAKLITVFDVYNTGVGDTGEETDVNDGGDDDAVGNYVVNIANDGGDEPGG